MVDHRKRIIDIEAGWPGSVNDARIFTNSSLNRIHDTWLSQLPTARVEMGLSLNSDEIMEEVPAFILGDSAYPNTRHMVTTFRLTDIGNDPAIKELNKKLGSTRYVVENAFGIMKQRFQLFKSPLECAHEDVKYAIELTTAIFILHNFLLDVKDRLNDDIVPENQPQHDIDGNREEQRVIHQGMNTRDVLKRQLEYILGY